LTENDLFLLSEHPKGTIPLDIGHVNILIKIHKRHINNISIKCKSVKTVKDITRKFKNTGNK